MYLTVIVEGSLWEAICGDEMVDRPDPGFGALNPGSSALFHGHFASTNRSTNAWIPRISAKTACNCIAQFVDDCLNE
jgi:hypothetical protein